MKHLNQFITEYIIKKKLDKPIDSEDHYEYHPENKKQLIRNISELFKKGETNLNCIDTSKITDMSNLFYYEKSKHINFDISGWNVSKVKYMQYMFNGLKNFDCDLSKWNVSNVTDMSCMFEGCNKFEGKGLDNWDVSNVTNMENLFVDCYVLNSDLSEWNVSKVKDMDGTFYNCKKFNCDLSKWNVKNVKYMSETFSNCTSLKNKPRWYKSLK